MWAKDTDVPPTTATPEPAAVAAPAPSGRSFVLPGWWAWGVGVLLGLVVLGPGMGGGSLLSLDLLVTPDIPIPNGVFGLGPALSQRVPMFALLGVGSAVVGGPVITKVCIVAFVAVGFAGAAHLTRALAPAGFPAGVATQAAAGLLWAVGPFALTRIAVGHINLLWVVAVLPWALPRLCRPGDHLPSTYLASLALAIGGPGGGTLGVAVGLISLVVTGRRGQVLRPLVALLVPQLVWVLPTAFLLWAGAGVTGAGDFATVTGGSSSWPALAAGNGFWRNDFQVGAAGWLGVACGLAVLGLAVVGGVDLVRRRGWRSWPGAATVVGVAGLVLACASAVPGVRDGYAWLSELPFGAPLRESARFLALWLVWAAPAAALGGAVLARRAGRAPWRQVALAAPLVVALALSVPGWWGLDGRLEPVEYPRGWAAARDEIRADPGTVVALPWSEYPALSFAGGRQAFNPVPEYLGGDVISSYDPGFDRREPRQEQVDLRAQRVDELVAELRRGRPIGPELVDLGVRWVILVHESDWADYRGGVELDPALVPVLQLPDVDLYEVRGWSGRASSADGEGFDLRRPVPPVLLTDAPSGSTLHVAGAPGWVQGWFGGTTVTDDGELRLDGDGGVVWFWPAVVLVVVDLALLVGVVYAVRSRSRNFGRILAPGAPRG